MKAQWLLLVSIPVVVAGLSCKPACPEYWEPACELCGQQSEACVDAKEVGETLAGKDAECSRTAKVLTEKASNEVFVRRYCNTLDATTPPDVASLTAGPWICNGVRVVFGEATFAYGDELHPMADLRIGRFQLTGGPAYERRPDDGALWCRYDLGVQEWSIGEVALSLRCDEGVGLPTDWAKCLRE